MSLVLGAELLAFPPGERRQREALAGEFAALVARKPLAELRRLRDELARLPTVLPTGDAGAGDDRARLALLEARARNLARVLEDRARLTAECLPTTTVRAGLGVSRQRLHQLVRDGRLVAVTGGERRALRYPAWQFGGDGRPLPGLARLIAAARAAELDPATLHFLMTEPHDRLAGRTPADALTEGAIDAVVAIVELAGFGTF
jgi:hypothetical protein